MSLTRQLLNESLQFFRMLEEPLRGRSSALSPLTRSLFDDPIFTAPRFARPAVDVSEDGANYVVETELPGVKKEDVEVRIGGGGRSITIEGSIMQRRTHADGGGSTTSPENMPQDGSAEGGHA
jgi:HSP20 family molecular chaperone IbpA